MSNNSIVEHRDNYYYVEAREEYIEICKASTYKKPMKNGAKSKASPYCKALILAILENWLNNKRGKGEDLVVYMSYPQWIDAMYGMFGRNVIIDSIDELIGEGLISREPYKMFGRDSFQYRLNCQELNRRIKLLPERDPDDVYPRTSLKVNATSLKVNGSDLQVNASSLKRDGYPLKSKRNIESNIESTKKLKEEESIANEVSASEPLAPSVALSPASQSSLSSFPQEETQEEQSPIATVTTGNDQSVEQKSLMPDLPTKASSKKKEKHTEPLTPKKVPEMPGADMEWGTKKCMLMFDAWRGHILIGYYKLSQASTCAKGLAEQYTEEDVRRVYQSMSEDAFWQEKGLDICNVSNNIHKEIKKTKRQKQPIPVQSGATERPSFLVSEEKRQRNLERQRARSLASGNE